MKKKSNISIFSFISFLVLLGLSGFLFGVIISLLSGEFSIRLLRLAAVNSVFLSLGITFNLLIIRGMVLKIRKGLIYLISISFTTGICFFGFIFAFILEPVFFITETNIVSMYLIINFIFIISLSIITTGLIIFQSSLEEKQRIINKEKDLRRDVERKLYTSRINPHFLFNSLNLMISLLKKPETAEKALIALSELLRFNLDSTKNESISMKLEIQNVEKYLYIQKLRFGERLCYKIKNKCSIQIPPMILQPLVENSVKHNIDKVDILNINIEIINKNNCCEILVYDNIKKLNPNMIGLGTGLLNTKKRVELAGGNFKINNGGIIIKFRL